MRKIQQANLQNRRVIIRCDLDVVKNSKIKDDQRLILALPTIQLALKKGAKKIILIGHNGKPKNNEKDLSLKPVAKWFEKKLKRKIDFDTFGRAKITLVENLRFHPGEKTNDKGFAQRLASLADIYINNAFASSHRKHASIIGIPKYLPGYAGLQLQEEIKLLENITKKPKKPLISLLGFAKIHDKITVLEKLLKKSDRVLFGGGVIFTFYKAEGYQVGKSLVDQESLAIAKQLLRTYSSKIMLPVDVVLDNGKIVDYDQIPKNRAGMDIGPQTVENYKTLLATGKTIFWNGPVGVFEKKPFDKATNKLAKFCEPLNIIAGGGDTTKAIKHAKANIRFSTGGGAALEYIQGTQLPGIKAILNSPSRAKKS